MNDYTLTWVENEQPNTVYFRGSDEAALALAEGLSLHDTFVDVVLNKLETAVQPVTLRKKVQ